jgi:hypothetical protein
LTITFLSVKSQELPDKIKIVQNTYEYSAFIDTIELYNSDTIVLTNKRKISKLLAELESYDNEEQILERFEIDTAFIRISPNEVLKLYDGKKKFDWNEKQKEYILGKINDLNVCKEELNSYISSYAPRSKNRRFSISRLLRFRRVGICGMGMPTYRNEFIISVYNENDIRNIFTSKRRTSGYYFPYKDLSDRVAYNYKIDKQLNEIFKRKIKIEEPLKGNDLLKHIVNQVVDNNVRELYKLSAYSYENEISELSSDFEIISSEEVYGRGRYIWNEPKTIKITLKNEQMLPNVYIQFLASQYGETLYSRDSIKKEYKDILSRVQSITFITDYLKLDSSAKLDIYYFNNSGINKYNVDGVNKNPSEWQKQDDYIESLKWYETSDIKPSFDIDKAIKTSERNYCGCNYRFESNFIKEAIFFEIKSARNPSSIWFLLPDETVLLYHLESYHLEDAKVIDKRISQYSTDIKLPWACLRFDRKGKLINKE